MKVKLHDSLQLPYYKRISYLYIPAVFVCVSILMEIMMFSFAKLPFPPAYIFSLCLVLFIAVCAAILPMKRLQVILCSVFLGAQLFFTISNVIAYQTGNGIFSLETIMLLDTAFKNKDAVSLDLWFITPLILLIVAYIVAVALIMWFCYVPAKYRRFERQHLLCGILAFVSCFTYSFNYSVLPAYGTDFVANLSNQKFIFDTLSNRISKMQTFGSYAYYIDNLLALIGGKKKVTSVLNVEIDNNLIPNQFALDTTEVLGEGYNLISILMETFERQAINPITMPNLYQFMQQSCTEVNGYYSVERTCFADHISQTGTHPEGKEYWLSYRDIAVPHALGNIFQRSNYVTAAFHNTHGLCYERNVFFEKTMGFQKFYNYETYGDESTRHEEQYAFNSDELLFGANLSRIMPSDSDRNFYSYIITASTHITDAKKYDLHEYYSDEFELIEKERWDELTKLYPVLLSDDPVKVLTAKNYLAGTCSFDKGFGELLEYLKTNKNSKGEYLIEKTAIVMFGDHYYYTTPDVLKTEIPNPTSLTGNRCPLIVYNPREKIETPTAGIVTQAQNALLPEPADCGKTINRFTSSLDIYPTICSLFGIQTDQQITYGRSIYDTESSIGVAFLSGYIFGSVEKGYDAQNDKWAIWRTCDFVNYNGLTLTQEQLAKVKPIVNRTYASVFLTSDLYANNGFKSLQKAYYKLG